MFELLVVQDELILQPGELATFHRSIEAQVKERYLQRVIVQGGGLCIAVKSINVRE